MSRNVLDYRRHAAANRPSSAARPKHGHLRGPGAKSAVADHRVGLRQSQVQARRAIGVETQGHQFVGDQAVVQLDGLGRGLRIARIEGAEGLGGAALPRQGGFSRCTRPPS